MMVLMTLYLNLGGPGVSLLFPCNTINSLKIYVVYFNSCIDILHTCLLCLITWSERDERMKTMPM